MYIPTQFLRIDYVVQSTLIALNTLLIIIIPFNLDFILTLLVFQIFLGGYQFLTALVHYTRATPSPTIKAWRGLHLIVSVVLVFMLWLGFLLGADGTRAFGSYSSAIASGLLGLVFPQIIAYLYYYLTRLDYKSRVHYLKNRATFSM